jgi:murein tripeptide amidase MpaA
MTIVRRSAVGALVALLVAAFAPAARTDTATPMVVRVAVTSETQAAYLLSHFDETHNHSADEIELLLWPGDRAELDARGSEYDVVVEDLIARDAALAAGAPVKVHELPGPNRSDYRHLADYNAELKRLAKKNPRLVNVFKMKRKSLEGRQVFGVEIAANVKRKDGRPIFYIDGVHHAREWPAAEYVQIFIHDLVAGFGKDRKVTSLLRRARVIAVPIVNVDGFEYSRESPQALNPSVDSLTDLTGAGNGFEAYWRKNRRSFTGATAPVVQKNPDAYGVDPNRNYSYLWGDQQGGSSNIQFEQTYRGAAPFSEPEVRNVRDIILSRSVTGVITNHTFQGSVLRAGGGDAPEDRILNAVGERLAKILGYQNNATVGYPTTGTTDDWAYAVMGALGYTIESGVINFHPPYAQEIGKFWKQHNKAYLVMLDVAANPKYHSIIKGRVAGGKAKLTITKTFKTPLSEGNPINKKFVVEKMKMTLPTSGNGSFVWHLGPSSRPFEKRAEAFTLTIKSGGRSKTIKVFVDRGQIRNLGTIRL